ncbi:MAG TPA: S9 family peptidase [Candidatus Didemnitutus sp.]|nr:S9 family peptidase [Candidatus Didemnitutus sp.]
MVPSRLSLAIVLMCASSPVLADLTPPAQPAPVADRQPRDVTVHGDIRIDDYFWLRDKANPEVRSYLEKENAYLEAVLAPEAKRRDALYAEMKARIKEDDVSARTPFLGYLYYSRTEAGKQYPVYCRIKDAPNAVEEILVDLNELGRGKPYVAIGHYHVSDDGARLAYSIDWTGYRQYEVFVLDLATKKSVPQQIGKVSDLVWGAGHDLLYYVTENDAKRSDTLHRWNLAADKGEVLYTDPDELYNLELSRSGDSRYVFCESHSKLTSEVRAIRADDPAAVPVVLLAREENHEYHAGYHNGSFYFVTNKGAKNFRIVAAPEGNPRDWHDVTLPRSTFKIDSIELFARQMVIHGRENGLPQIESYDLQTQVRTRFAMPDAVYDVTPGQNWEYAAPEYRFRYESLARPPSVLARSYESGATRVVKETQVLGGFSAGNYRTERIWATARDGVKIPLSIVYRADLDRTRPQPLYLYGYGSYGISIEAAFSSNRISLLDRGVVYVIAHIRGGGEMGEEWREAGRMERKMTTFTDFVDCAQWLVNQKWTTPAQMVTAGGSAGGLLMGATVNLRPDLFKAAILYVPFVDVVNTMLDASLPLTTEEYIEWGNPNVEKEYRWIREYSPYDNLKRASYPNLLVNVSFFDSQVPYWEGAKFAAKARTLNAGGSLILLHTNFGAGHGGSSGRYDALHDVARDYAFVLAALGLKS